MLKKVFQVLATLLLVLVILACVGIFIAPRFGWHLDVVYGGSMEPAIKLGSLAVIQPVDPQDVGVGDVITYRSSTESGTVTTHRVVEVVNDGSLSFRTKGDANEDPDVNAVPAENVVGSVWMSVPYVGYAMDFIRTPLGFGLLIGIPAALIVGIELKNIVVAVKDLRRKGRVKRVRRVPEGHINEDIRCPICGSTTVVRKAKKGPDAGLKFYVCTRYPECKGRVPILQAPVERTDIARVFELDRLQNE